MTDRMTDTSSDPVREILEHWKAAFDGHQVETMAGLFTDDALFQGLGAVRFRMCRSVRECARACTCSWCCSAHDR
ncbi:hypothetical protein ACWGQ5_54730, partial [Streptomyces sp. NPDC055722]